MNYKKNLINYFKTYYNNAKYICYNICSIFFITTNLFIPVYSEEIIYFNVKVIEGITVNYKLNSELKKNNFTGFVKHLINENDIYIDKINKEKEQYENIENYVIDNEYTSSECSNNSFDSEDSDERKDS
jgi:hypothetical protein